MRTGTVNQVFWDLGGDYRHLSDKELIIAESFSARDIRSEIQELYDDTALADEIYLDVFNLLVEEYDPDQGLGWNQIIETIIRYMDK